QAEDGIRDFHVTGVQTCALPIFIPIGFSPLQVPLLKNMILFLMPCLVLKNLKDLPWFSKSQMPPLFLMAGSEPRLKPEVILLGIRVLPFLSSTIHFVSPLFSFLLPERPWITKHLYYDPWKL